MVFCIRSLTFISFFCPFLIQDIYTHKYIPELSIAEPKPSVFTAPQTYQRLKDILETQCVFGCVLDGKVKHVFRREGCSIDSISISCDVGAAQARPCLIS